jgi:thiol-disulfide isomerase/thioredoxin
MIKRLSLLLFLLILSACNSNEIKPVELDPSTYLKAELIEFSTYEELEDKISSGDSFVLYVYTSNCDVCMAFKPVINQFIEEREITIYSIENSIIKNNSWLDKQVGKVPTVLIINKEKRIAQLDPNDGEHTSYFESSEGFGVWFDKFVIKN